jgi:signal transduction histidine kinase
MREREFHLVWGGAAAHGHAGAATATPLNEYSAQLGAIVARHRAEAALVAARQRAERLAAEAQNAMVEAQAANRAKTEFLANVSHELRTPLNAIIGFSELMTHLEISSLDKIREYSRDIHASGNHLLELINDILDLAKIDASRLELHEEIVDPAALVASCLSLIRERAARAGLALGCDLAPNLPRLRADARRIKQIFINLLSNAVKFTPAGGTVSVALFVGDERCLVGRVSDTGIGISAENLAKVFVPFTQVDGALNRKYEGTGLGLSLTKGFVELHGGTLMLESALGRGTIATVRLPAARTCGGLS